MIDAARGAFRAARHPLLAPLLAAMLAGLTVLTITPPSSAAADPTRRPGPAFPLSYGDRGQRVRDAQWLLAGHNRYGIRTYNARPTGFYDARTHNAVLKAKWLLGYPKDNLRPIYGVSIRNFLTGRRPLPPLHIVRRASRNPYRQLEVSYPLANRGGICGWPGQGTHSFTEPPANWQSDQAVDLCVAEGTPILAVRAGTICLKLGALYPGSTGRFGGIRFYLCDTRGNVWYYQHAKATAPGLKLGSRVHAGQTIAYVGVAGVAHLHLACRDGCNQRETFFPILNAGS